MWWIERKLCMNELCRWRLNIPTEKILFEQLSCWLKWPKVGIISERSRLLSMRMTCKEDFDWKKEVFDDCNLWNRNWHIIEMLAQKSSSFNAVGMARSFHKLTSMCRNGCSLSVSWIMNWRSPQSKSKICFSSSLRWFWKMKFKQCKTVKPLQGKITCTKTVASLTLDYPCGFDELSIFRGYANFHHIKHGCPRLIGHRKFVKFFWVACCHRYCDALYDSSIPCFASSWFF